MQVKNKYGRKSLKYKIDSLLLYKFYQYLANSNATKEALKCTASMAADSIVDAISIITGVLFCSVTREQVSAKFGFGFGRIWVPKFGRIWKSQIRCNPSFQGIVLQSKGSTS